MRKTETNPSIAVIDDNFAGAFLENNPGNGGFSPTGAEDRLRGEPAGKPRLHVILQVGGLQLLRRSGDGGGDDERRESRRVRHRDELRSVEGEAVWLGGNL